MSLDEIIFDDYVVCPICKKQMKTLSGSHLIKIHGYSSMKEFKIEYGIPMNVALVAKTTRNKMVKKGKLRSDWFKKNVMPIGVEYTRNIYSQNYDVVPKEIRAHAGRQRKGKDATWVVDHILQMKEKGWLDLRSAAELLGVSYNYTRKCATDGRLKVILEKGIRFTKLEWIEDSRKLLQENREKAELHKRQFGQSRKKTP